MKRARLLASLVLLAALDGRSARTPPSASSDRAALEKLSELQDVLRDRNDDDPRLDADFNALSAEARRLFRAEYARLPRENRNERGTIVYLLSRNALDADDWVFLREVVEDPPCLSLADCAKSSARGDQVTLAYPALVALKQLERRFSHGPTDREADSILAAGRRSRTPAVARLAARLTAELQ